MSAKLTVGLIGLGERGKTLAEVMRGHVEGVELVAIADPDQKAQSEALKMGVDVFTSDEELLEKRCPDIIVIATNPPHHHEQVMRAAEAGCHVLCEKPLALSAKDADKMLSAVDDNGVFGGVVFETIFSDSYPVLRRLAQEEWFGSLRHITATDKGRPPAYDIETCMSHFLHLFMQLLGVEPIEVFGQVLVDGRLATREDIVAVNDLYPAGRQHDIGLRADVMRAAYRYSNGVPLQYNLAQLDEEYVKEAGKRAKPGSEYMHFVLHGTRGRIKFHQTSGGFIYVNRLPEDILMDVERSDDDALKGRGHWQLVHKPAEPDPSWVVPTTRLILDFVDAIHKGREPLANIHDAALVVHQSTGIYASHLAGRPLSLPLLDTVHPLK